VNNRLIPTCMETRSVLAEPNADGTLTVYIPSQVPHMHRRWIAETVGIPEHLLRIIAPDIGGGFGARCTFIRRSCSVRFWRAPSAFQSSGGNRARKATNPRATGRAHTENIEIAVRNDGRILGLKVETLGNVGAYLSNMASGGPTGIRSTMGPAPTRSRTMKRYRE